MTAINQSKRKIFKKGIEKRPKTIPVGLRLAAVWGVYVISLIGVFLWLRVDIERTLTLFQESKLCDNKIPMQNQENCYEELQATVRKVSFIYNGQGRLARYGEGSSRNKVDAFDLDLELPDGSTSSVYISKDKARRVVRDRVKFNPTAGWSAFDPFDIYNFQNGDILTVTRWRGKVISIKATLIDDLLIGDHPKNYAKHYEKAGSIFGLMFIVLFVWSLSELLKKRS